MSNLTKIHLRGERLELALVASPLYFKHIMGPNFAASSKRSKKCWMLNGAVRPHHDLIMTLNLSGCSRAGGNIDEVAN